MKMIAWFEKIRPKLSHMLRMGFSYSIVRRSKQRLAMEPITTEPIKLSDVIREKYLSIALRLVGLVAVFGLYPLTLVWPSGWCWGNGRPEYLEMILVVYGVLGFFLVIASFQPAKHTSLISFAIWSSVGHGTIMMIQALSNPANLGHLYGDVPAVFAIAAVLGGLCPRAVRLDFSQTTTPSVKGTSCGKRGKAHLVEHQ